MNWMRLTLAAAALAASITGSGQYASAAQDTPQWHYHDGFKDAATGRSYYRALREPQNNAPYDQFRVIYATKEGNWFSLPDRYWNIGSLNDGTLLLGDKGMIAGTTLSSSIYDPASDKITHETRYTASPNGKWGLQITEHYPYHQGKQLIVLVKNYSTGQVRKLAFSTFYSNVRWMPDNRLLGKVYNEKAKQNEIVTIDPATGRTHRLLFASLNSYDAKSSLILFAYNEPARKNWVYDIKTGGIHAATEAELEKFYTTEDTDFKRPEKPAIAPPADLQSDQLPSSPLTELTIEEAQAVINGKTIGLPSAFLEDSRAWIAVQPLTDAFGVQAEKINDRPYSGTYRITSSAGSIVVDETSARNYGGRLFLTKDQLEKLGLHLERFDWVSR